LENYSQKSGGALYASQSEVTIAGNISVINNVANKSGGGAFLYMTHFFCRGNCTFSGNTAYQRGGGIYAVGTLISASYSSKHDYEISLTLIGNRAEEGGGLYLQANSKLTGIANGYTGYEISFIENMATEDGGAIFVEDKNILRHL
jgi:predicted outer membrane repeat protein